MENLTEQIENGIIELKQKRFNDDKRKQYNLIASMFNRYFNQTRLNNFKRSLIISFFPSGFYRPTTEKRHIKNIIDTLKEKNIIVEDKISKITKQRRVYELKSKDYDSYFFMMRANGYKKINYYEHYADKDGIPRKRVIATSNINGLPIDKNGDSVEDFDSLSLCQTIARHKQGVNAYTFKSIADEKREYFVKGFRVVR